MVSEVGFCKPFIKRQIHIHCHSPAPCLWGGEIHSLREIRRTRDASFARAPVISSFADFSLKGETICSLVNIHCWFLIVLGLFRDLFSGFVLSRDSHAVHFPTHSTKSTKATWQQMSMGTATATATSQIKNLIGWTRRTVLPAIQFKWTSPKLQNANKMA